MRRMSKSIPSMSPIIFVILDFDLIFDGLLGTGTLWGGLLFECPFEGLPEPESEGSIVVIS